MPPKVKKYEINIGKIVIFCFQTILTFSELWKSFWCELGSILAWFLRSWSILGRLGPSWGRLGDVRGRLAASTENLNFLNDFGIDVLMVLASFWEPSSAWLGPRWRPKSAKNLTGGLPGGVTEPTMYPNSFLEASAMIFFGIFDGFYWFLDNCWMIFGRNLDEFGRLFF